MNIETACTKNNNDAVRTVVSQFGVCVRQFLFESRLIRSPDEKHELLDVMSI
jgi:hypothetical protein